MSQDLLPGLFHWHFTHRTTGLLLAVLLSGTIPAHGAEALFSFQETAANNVFDVYFSLEGDDTRGLSTYVVTANDTSQVPVDVSGISFTPANLNNIRVDDYALVGFNTFLSGAIGTSSYDAVYSQFASLNPLWGIGLESVFSAAAPDIPNNYDIDLGVPAYLGQLDLGIDVDLGIGDLYSVFSANAAVFDTSGSNTSVFAPDVYITLGGPDERVLVNGPSSDPPAPDPDPVPDPDPDPTYLQPPAWVVVGEDLPRSPDEVSFILNDLDRDEHFEVTFEAYPGAVTGLAMYNLGLEGLDSSFIDETLISWEQANISNFTETFQLRGFNPFDVFSDLIGPGSYFIANSQSGSPYAVDGIGVTPIYISDNETIPVDEPIDLDVPAVLGTLHLPGANAISDRELNQLLNFNAALFVGQGNNVVQVPDTVYQYVRRSNLTIPEPAGVVMMTFVVAGLAGRRWRNG